MMSCTCRATPLKIFVQGLSQVHKVDASPSLLRLPIRTRPALYQNNFALARQARSLHFSKALQDASGEAARDDDPFSHIRAEDENSAVKNDDPFATDENPESIPWKAQPGTNNETQKPRRKKREKPEDFTTLNYRRNQSVRQQLEDDEEANELNNSPNRRMKGPSSLQPQPKENYWKIQKAALKEKFPEGWRPRKRLSPDALAGIRALNAQFPDVYTTEALSNKFEVSPEAIRRILRSKWQADPDEEEKRNARWFRRGKEVWEQKAALGIKPPQKWRREGITRDPSYHDWKKEAVERNRAREERDDLEIRGENAPRRRAYTPRSEGYTPRPGPRSENHTPRSAPRTEGYTPRARIPRTGDYTSQTVPRTGRGRS
ncbi:Required for respiratory growth 9, mitochondrial [Fusarium agapanthi]|uniref:Required for respiratory growth protein 9, mitochondrial n=1 Tax=Fusarium agapanthi TaxID=1803897 RepID=A0A9P5E737_9HYPO|nr:Required for respiratory growth 9, mitochondrial [Fusarium agapanthi]